MHSYDMWLRLRALLFPRRAERDLHDEIGFHLEMAQRKYEARGSSPADAARTARATFGSVALVKDLARDQRGIGTLERCAQDIRYALRGFRRAPTFIATIVGTIALGLGLNTAVFTIFNAYVLKAFAVRDPYSLYEVQWQSRAGQWHRFGWSEYEQFRHENELFSDVAAERPQLVTPNRGASEPAAFARCATVGQAANGARR